MSWSKPIASDYSDVDEAIEQLMAEMDREYNIISTANPKAKPSNSSTMPPPTTTFIHVKRTNSNSAPNPSSKYQKLDDDEADSFLSQRDMELFEEMLYSQYMSTGDEKEYAEGDSSGSTNTTTVDEGDEDEDGSDSEVLPLPSCVPCASDSKRIRSSDSALKNYAFDMPRMSIGRCSSDCGFGGNCVGQTTIDEMATMVIDFWDESDCEAPSSQTRRVKVLKILRSAFRPNDGTFQFFAGCKEKDNRRVCEAGFLILLGISNSPNASKAPGQWKRMKKYVSSGKDAAGIEYKSQSEEKLMKAESKGNKMKSALTFIEYFAQEFGDTIPGAEGNEVIIPLTIQNNNKLLFHTLGGGKNVYVAPFVDLRSFWEEYCAYHAHQQTQPSDVAALSTFCAAFNVLSETKGIKKLKAKGTFNTCEICNNASDLLKNKSKCIIIKVYPYVFII